MTIIVELPDDQAAVLKAKAEAQGCTLEAWLTQLATSEVPARPRKGRYSLAELMAQCDPTAPLSAEDRAWTLPSWAERLCKVERGDVYHVALNPTQGREQAAPSL